MAETLRIGGEEIATVKISGIQGQPALGFHRLTFQIEFVFHSRTEDERVKIIELGGELMVRGGTQETHYVGRLVPRSPPVSIDIMPHSRPRTEYLEIQLDRYKLEALEKIRLGKSLSFIVSLWGRAAAESKLSDFAAQVTHEVNQGTWVETLQAIGFTRMLLLEVPVPATEGIPELMEAVSYLTQAQEALNRGRYREAIGLCRDVLEATREAAGDETFVPEAQALFDGARTWDKETRIRVVRRSLTILCHPARHADEVASHIDWDRLDAITVLTMVTALVQRLGQ